MVEKIELEVVDHNSPCLSASADCPCHTCKHDSGDCCVRHHYSPCVYDTTERCPDYEKEERK